MTLFAPWASFPDESRGRRHDETKGLERGPRDAFQRDRDRIIHSISFRRLRHKTQVFMAPDGDHFRVRLTHSLEVAQIGRTIARTLGLNEDLTEALCLAHDIGHPPFGHAGEDALKAALDEQGGFDHNGHTLRTLTEIERPYPRWDGLNLTWETLEGLAKHNGPVRHPGWALREADAGFPLDLDSHASLEAQVAALADDIAYDNHDIDDGLRAGLLTLDQLLAVPLVARGWDTARAKFPDVAPKRLASELIRSQIGVMVNDLVAETRARITESGVGDVTDVRAAGRALVGFSEAMRVEERDLKRFMYANLYHHPRQLAAADAAHGIVKGLFAAYRADPAQLPEEWRERLPEAEPERSRHIADFIAGMTDRYAVRCYQDVVGAIDLPEGF
ncbi:deoxyguanosinetriphosphate triphosphohydrolase, family protein [Sphingomonas sp. S17]|jgi:dGTPase|uniref:Deoxyguanosinetriphosphate triphosphohydrolase-like protein n=2 Tax=Sphingomonas paucimobilis TaxID=13689 RepID=A0A411LHW5_SPHPI|nr:MULTISPECIES: deoxyguanosinetriphosphate triphosphohydrolase [Sphingomonas]EGI54916.1 deoxyguanosinetriphosphate triphosphohydrolase, family protein [Sphingomonas sp. S17]MBQ1479455.1 deoxyguanosinetriphosphate triphosphohydrolase [Sphingomonas sp.]MCM3678024.1 deoxyguanosinetriphosphate triphosphohydrolase [Sphingomonas paucimobilis]MDG5972656.1 deoxyguanosinetriphosphate triphosphohydrolase [Sphingomonas paucimobilis]NNG56610.1 deoxyguanosinetriphosphate triphosphohydrolase [Sphingomonas 